VSVKAEEKIKMIPPVTDILKTPGDEKA